MIGDLVVCIGHIDLAFEYMRPINAYRPNEHLGRALSHPEQIGVQTGYSESRGKISMLLSPKKGSRVVDHEQKSTVSS